MWMSVRYLLLLMSCLSPEQLWCTSRERVSHDCLDCTECSDDSSLIMVGILVKDKGHRFVPGGLEYCVLQPSFICTVMPAGQIAGAVRIVRRRVNLTPVYTALTSKPSERKRKVFLTQCSTNTMGFPLSGKQLVISLLLKLLHYFKSVACIYNRKGHL